jgi:hypothetical protein
MAVDVENGTDVPSHWHRPSSSDATVHDDHACGPVASKEKPSGVSTTAAIASAGDCPDGGWRAWMALLGVSSSHHKVLSFSDP